MSDLPANYINDAIEQNTIESALWDALPENTHWHNIVMAVSRVLQDAVYESVKGKLKYSGKRTYKHENKDATS